MSNLTSNDGFAIVTGAGSGLGRALAAGLVAEGFTVIGTGRRASALEDTAVALGARFIPHALDVSDAQAVRETVAALCNAHGPLALLINNAAVFPKRDFTDETGESFAETIAINLGGVVNCTRSALDDMMRRGKGRILNVATYADLNPLPCASAYSVSKGAARILTRALVADLSDRFPGIVITDWMPGMLATEMGIPDGLCPQESAKWGVKLALMREASLNGATFEMDCEILPPRGLKGKVKDLVTFRLRAPRRL